jgi:hypothetical protein
MSNSLYDAARASFLTQGIHWINDTIKVYLVNTSSYSVNLAAHDFLDDVPSGARVAGPVTLGTSGTKSTTGGAADGPDITFSTVTGSTVQVILIEKDTGTESTSNLIAYIDSATGLPITPNGGDIIVTWDNGTNKIFRV